MAKLEIGKTVQPIKIEKFLLYFSNWCDIIADIVFFERT